MLTRFPYNLVMLRHRFSRSFALALAFLYVGQSAFAYAPENNFWAERRRQVERRARPALQVASLPSAWPSGSAVPLVAGQPIPSHLKVPSSLAPRLTPLLQSISSAQGSVRAVRAPKAKDKRKTVVFLQDVHRNAEAQMNISRILQGLWSRGLGRVVALEGAFEPVRLDDFHAFPDQEIVRDVADHMLETLDIAGPMHAALSSPARGRLEGIDDEGLHRDHIQAYRGSVQSHDLLLKRANATLERLESLKEKRLNQALRSLDLSRTQYQREQIEFADYLRHLASAHKGNMAREFPALHGFMQVLHLENQVDFAEVEKERVRLVQALASKISNRQQNKLIQWTAAFRLGDLSPAAFHQALMGTCREAGIPMDSYPRMDAYLRYLVRAEALQSEKILMESQALESRAMASLVTTPGEAKLLAVSEKWELRRKLLDHSLTRQEWDKLVRLEDPGSTPEFWKDSLPAKPFHHFYHLALARDRAMARNLLRLLEKDDTVVLVAGGFHADGLEKVLSESGVTVVTVVPKLTRIQGGKGSSYLSVFAQTKTPLEELFKGKKLFLAERAFTPGDRAKAAVRVSSAAQIKIGGDAQARLAASFPKVSSLLRLTVRNVGGRVYQSTTRHGRRVVDSFRLWMDSSRLRIGETKQSFEPSEKLLAIHSFSTRQAARLYSLLPLAGLWSSLAAAVAAQGPENFGPRILTSLVVLAGGIVHEYAHAWTADRLGDDTARIQGRLTLARFWRHFEAKGLTAILTSTLFLGMPLGWLKPVPVSFWRLKPAGIRLVALAGPAANLALAGTLGAAAFLSSSTGVLSFVAEPMFFAAKVNLALAVINLLPLPPLDGSRILGFPAPLKIRPWGAAAAGSALSLGLGWPGLAAYCEERPLAEFMKKRFKGSDPKRKAEFVRQFYGQLERHYGRPKAVIRSTIRMSEGFLKKQLELAAKQVPPEEEIKKQEEIIDKHVEESAKALTQGLNQIGEALSAAAQARPEIRTQADPYDLEHAAAHAVEQAMALAVEQNVQDAARFGEIFQERLQAELRTGAEAPLSADSAEAVGRLVDDTRLETGETLSEALQSWVEEFQVFSFLRETRESLTRTSSPAAQARDEETYGSSGTGHMIARAIIFVLGSILSLWTGVPLLQLSISAARPQPFQEFLTNFRNSRGQTLTEEEQNFLLGMGVDLVDSTAGDRPVIGRSREVSDMLAQVMKPPRSKNSLLLIGPPGVGKTAMVEKLALELAKDGRRVLSVQAGSLGSGPQLLQNLTQLTNIVKKTENKIVLFIDEIHSLFQGPGGGYDSRASNFLKPMLEKGEITQIGGTTLKEFSEWVERDGAFVERHTLVRVEEPSPEEAKYILDGIKGHLEEKFDVRIDNNALRAAIVGSDRAFPDKALPRKAIDALENALGYVRARYRSLSITQEDIFFRLLTSLNAYVTLKKEGFGDNARDVVEAHNRIVGALDAFQEVEGRRQSLRDTGRLRENDVLEYLSRASGIPMDQLSHEEAERYGRMEQELRRRIIGQDEAIESIARAVRHSKAGLKDPNRPVLVIYLLGTTGVGKTEIAKATAEFMFGSEKDMTRFDMSEYQEKHTVARFTGSPPGYVGYDEGGQLTEAIRRKRYQVLLFDETDKAHEKVLEVFLQIFEEGRLTDGKGQPADFTESVIIMTSNLGTRAIQDQLQVLEGKLLAAETEEEADRFLDEMNALVKEGTERALKETYRPEFLNRIDRVVTCEMLSPAQARQIARILVAKELKPLAEKGIQMEIADGVYESLAARGYSVLYGARPLRRLIQQEIGENLSDYLLKERSLGKNPKGTVKLFVSEGKTAFSFEPTATPWEKRSVQDENQAVFNHLLEMAEGLVDSPDSSMSRQALEQALDWRRATNGNALLRGVYGPFQARAALGASPANTKSANHNNPGMKDSAVDQALEAVKLSAGAERQAVAEKWFRQFVQLAKTHNAGGQIQMAWEQAPGALSLQVTREGLVTSDEESFLRTHLTPEFQSVDEARAAARALVEGGAEPASVRLTLMELKAQLTALGAQFGFEESDNKVRYWLKLPGPTQTTEAPPQSAPSRPTLPPTQALPTAASAEASQGGQQVQKLPAQKTAVPAFNEQAFRNLRPPFWQTTPVDDTTNLPNIRTLVLNEQPLFQIKYGSTAWGERRWEVAPIDSLGGRFAFGMMSLHGALLNYRPPNTMGLQFVVRDEDPIRDIFWDAEITLYIVVTDGLKQAIRDEKYPFRWEIPGYGMICHVISETEQRERLQGPLIPAPAMGDLKECLRQAFQGDGPRSGWAEDTGYLTFSSDVDQVRFTWASDWPEIYELRIPRSLTDPRAILNAVREATQNEYRAKLNFEASLDEAIAAWEAKQQGESPAQGNAGAASGQRPSAVPSPGTVWDMAQRLGESGWETNSIAGWEDRSHDREIWRNSRGQEIKLSVSAGQNPNEWELKLGEVGFSWNMFKIFVIKASNWRGSSRSINTKKFDRNPLFDLYFDNNKLHIFLTTEAFDVLMRLDDFPYWSGQLADGFNYQVYTESEWPEIMEGLGLLQRAASPSAARSDFGPLWFALESLPAPLWYSTGSLSKRVHVNADEARVSLEEQGRVLISLKTNRSYEGRLPELDVYWSPAERSLIVRREAVQWLAPDLSPDAVESFSWVEIGDRKILLVVLSREAIDVLKQRGFSDWQGLASSIEWHLASREEASNVMAQARAAQAPAAVSAPASVVQSQPVAAASPLLPTSASPPAATPPRPVPRRAARTPEMDSREPLKKALIEILDLDPDDIIFDVQLPHDPIYFKWGDREDLEIHISNELTDSQQILRLILYKIESDLAAYRQIDKNLARLLAHKLAQWTGQEDALARHFPTTGIDSALNRWQADELSRTPDSWEKGFEVGSEKISVSRQKNGTWKVSAKIRQGNGLFTFLEYDWDGKGLFSNYRRDEEESSSLKKNTRSLVNETDDDPLVTLDYDPVSQTLLVVLTDELCRSPAWLPGESLCLVITNETDWMARQNRKLLPASMRTANPYQTVADYYALLNREVFDFVEKGIWTDTSGEPLNLRAQRRFDSVKFQIFRKTADGLDNNIQQNNYRPVELLKEIKTDITNRFELSPAHNTEFQRQIDKLKEAPAVFRPEGEFPRARALLSKLEWPMTSSSDWESKEIYGFAFSVYRRRAGNYIFDKSLDQSEAIFSYDEERGSMIYSPPDSPKLDIFIRENPILTLEWEEAAKTVHVVLADGVLIVTDKGQYPRDVRYADGTGYRLWKLSEWRARQGLPPLVQMGGAVPGAWLLMAAGAGVGGSGFVSAAHWMAAAQGSIIWDPAWGQFVGLLCMLVAMSIWFASRHGPWAENRFAISSGVAPYHSFFESLMNVLQAAGTPGNGSDMSVEGILERMEEICREIQGSDAADHGGLLDEIIRLRQSISQKPINPVYMNNVFSSADHWLFQAYEYSFVSENRFLQNISEGQLRDRSTVREARTRFDRLNNRMRRLSNFRPAGTGVSDQVRSAYLNMARILYEHMVRLGSGQLAATDEQQRIMDDKIAILEQIERLKGSSSPDWFLEGYEDFSNQLNTIIGYGHIHIMSEDLRIFHGQSETSIRLQYLRHIASRAMELAYYSPFSHEQWKFFVTEETVRMLKEAFIQAFVGEYDRFRLADSHAQRKYFLSALEEVNGLYQWVIKTNAFFDSNDSHQMGNSFNQLFGIARIWNRRGLAQASTAEAASEPQTDLEFEKDEEEITKAVKENDLDTLRRVSGTDYMKIALHKPDNAPKQPAKPTGPPPAKPTRLINGGLASEPQQATSVSTPRPIPSAARFNSSVVDDMIGRSSYGEALDQLQAEFRRSLTPEDRRLVIGYLERLGGGEAYPTEIRARAQSILEDFWGGFFIVFNDLLKNNLRQYIEDWMREELDRIATGKSTAPPEIRSRAEETSNRLNSPNSPPAPAFLALPLDWLLTQYDVTAISSNLSPSDVPAISGIWDWTSPFTILTPALFFNGPAMVAAAATILFIWLFARFPWNMGPWAWSGFASGRSFALPGAGAMPAFGEGLFFTKNKRPQAEDNTEREDSRMTGNRHRSWYQPSSAEARSNSPLDRVVEDPMTQLVPYVRSHSGQGEIRGLLEHWLREPEKPEETRKPVEMVAAIVRSVDPNPQEPAWKESFLAALESDLDKQPLRHLFVLLMDPADVVRSPELRLVPFLEANNDNPAAITKFLEIWVQSPGQSPVTVAEILRSHAPEWIDEVLRTLGQESAKDSASLAALRSQLLGEDALQEEMSRQMDVLFKQIEAARTALVQGRVQEGERIRETARNAIVRLAERDLRLALSWCRELEARRDAAPKTITIKRTAPGKKRGGSQNMVVGNTVLPLLTGLVSDAWGVFEDALAPVLMGGHARADAWEAFEQGWVDLTRANKDRQYTLLNRLAIHATSEEPIRRVVEIVNRRLPALIDAIRADQSRHLTESPAALAFKSSLETIEFIYIGFANWLTFRHMRDWKEAAPSWDSLVALVKQEGAALKDDGRLSWMAKENYHMQLVLMRWLYSGALEAGILRQVERCLISANPVHNNELENLILDLYLLALPGDPAYAAARSRLKYAVEAAVQGYMRALELKDELDQLDVQPGEEMATYRQMLGAAQDEEARLEADAMAMALGVRWYERSTDPQLRLRLTQIMNETIPAQGLDKPFSYYLSVPMGITYYIEWLKKNPDAEEREDLRNRFLAKASFTQASIDKTHDKLSPERIQLLLSLSQLQLPIIRHLIKITPHDPNADVWAKFNPSQQPPLALGGPVARLLLAAGLPTLWAVGVGASVETWAVMQGLPLLLGQMGWMVVFSPGGLIVLQVLVFALFHASGPLRRWIRDGETGKLVLEPFNPRGWDRFKALGLVSLVGLAAHQGFPWLAWIIGGVDTSTWLPFAGHLGYDLAITPLLALAGFPTFIALSPDRLGGAAKGQGKILMPRQVLSVLKGTPLSMAIGQRWENPRELTDETRRAVLNPAWVKELVNVLRGSFLERRPATVPFPGVRYVSSAAALEGARRQVPGALEICLVDGEYTDADWAALPLPAEDRPLLFVTEDEQAENAARQALLRRGNAGQAFFVPGAGFGVVQRTDQGATAHFSALHNALAQSQPQLFFNAPGVIVVLRPSLTRDYDGLPKDSPLSRENALAMLLGLGRVEVVSLLRLELWDTLRRAVESAA